MEIKTLMNIGDNVFFEGRVHKIIGIHIYVSNEKQTERYYLGEEKWLTIKRR